MSEIGIGRRAFLKGTAVALGTAYAVGSRASEAQFVVPNSAGSAAPRMKVPLNACDCHHHIYDAARFPQPPAATTAMRPNARVEEYRLLQRRLGTARDVVVTPNAYATDNRVTLDAIARLGPSARGVAVVGADVTDAELRALHEGGIRGIRFSLAVAYGISPPISAANAQVIESLSRRVNELGWHVQFNLTAEQIAAAAGLWDRLSSPLVFDHMGHMPQPEGEKHPAFSVMRRLVDKGRTWVKLSVAYDSSKIGPPTYADVNLVGRAWVQVALERMLWGSNWPHPNEVETPDDAVLLDLLAEWAPGEAARNRILVENPEALYGFERAAA